MSIRMAAALKDDAAIASNGRVADRDSREALLARIADHPHLPSPPGVVLQVLERASRLDSTPADLAAVIHRDPALCGQILKVVNSALYTLPRPTTSIERAVALLGFKPVRSLVLSLSLPAMQRQTSGPLPLETFWKESVAGAIVAHELALHLGRTNPEDDLVAGLLRDLGTLALQQVRPADYARLLAHPFEERSLRPCQLEEQLLGLNHAEVSAFLLRRWRLPEDIIESVRYHHAPEQAAGLPRPVVERARLLAFASRVALLQLAAAGAELLREILAQAREDYGMDEAALTAFLEPLAEKIQEFAAVMDIDIGACDHYPRVLARAAEELVKLTVETSVDKLRILEQKRQAEEQTQHWREQADRLRHEVVRDSLTDAFNRGCFEEELTLAFRRARRRGTVLGLVFLDLDDFKSINDRFGHPFGDRVLKRDGRQSVRRRAPRRHRGPLRRRRILRPGAKHLAGWTAGHDRAAVAGSQRTGPSAATATPSPSVPRSAPAVCLPRTYPHSAAEFLASRGPGHVRRQDHGKKSGRASSRCSDEADLCFLGAVRAPAVQRLAGRARRRASRRTWASACAAPVRASRDWADWPAVSAG